jgi:hypothetical protein
MSRVILVQSRPLEEVERGEFAVNGPRSGKLYHNDVMVGT